MCLVLLFTNNCYGVNLHAGVARQPGSLNRGTSGLVLSKVLAVDFIHPGELVHISEKDRSLDDSIKAASSSPQDSRQVLENLLSLFRDIAGNKLAGLWIDGNLSRRKEEPSGFDRLRVWADCLRRVISLDPFLHLSESLYLGAKTKTGF